MVLAMFTDKAPLSEQEAMVLAVVADKSRSDLRPLPGLTATNSDADRDTAAPQVHGKSSDIGEPIPMPPDQALDDLHRKVHSRRVPMTAAWRISRLDRCCSRSTHALRCSLNFRYLLGSPSRLALLRSRCWCALRLRQPGPEVEVSSHWTRCWREMDSNFRFRAPPYYDDWVIQSNLAAAGFGEIQIERVTEPEFRDLRVRTGELKPPSCPITVSRRCPPLRATSPAWPTSHPR